MRLCKIRNGYLFKGGSPNGTHIYAVYYDRSAKEYRAVQTTHLYNKDPKRFAQVKKGILSVMKFKDVELPSGVRNIYYNTTVKGDKININDKKNVIIINKKHLPKTQSDFIKNFAEKVHKE